MTSVQLLYPFLDARPFEEQQRTVVRPVLGGIIRNIFILRQPKLLTLRMIAATMPNNFDSDFGDVFPYGGHLRCRGAQEDRRGAVCVA